MKKSIFHQDIFEKIYLSYKCLAHECLCTMSKSGACGQKRGLDPLKLELWMLVSYYWVLRIKLGCGAQGMCVFRGLVRQRGCADSRLET